METGEYLNKSLKKLEEVEAKSELKNSTTKRDLDTKGIERQFEREENRKDSINNIGIVLMKIFALVLVAFMGLVFTVGIYPAILPSSNGTKALEELFILAVANSKIIILIVIGYFFRDYAGEMYSKVRDNRQ